MGVIFMKKSIMGLIIGLIIVIVVTVYNVKINNQEVNEIELTDIEIEWLENHPDIYYAPDPNWEPVDYVDENGDIKGLTVDFLDLVGSKIGVEFNKTVVGNWGETVESLKNKEIDIIAASYSESRSKHMLFTSSFYDLPYIYVIKSDTKEIKFEDVKNKKIALIAGWKQSEDLKRDHYGVEYIVYDTVSDALQGVSFGNVDLLIQEIASVSYLIEKDKISNLKSGGYYPDVVDLRFAIRDDYEILHGIISRVLQEISDSEKEEITSKWIKFDEIAFYKTREFINSLAVFIFVIFFMFLWSFSLRLKVKKKTHELSLALETSENMQLQLENSIIDLKNMQREMINSEKLATLGSMVASISHEINNPLGVCLTTVSTLELRTTKLIELYKENKMKKSDLDGFMEFTNECSHMLRLNVDSSINIIKRFKTLAVDQAIDEKTSFNICDYINIITDNMKYELKKKSVTVDVSCNIDGMIDSYPGAFSQIFTNLIMNSLIHGFIKSDANNEIHIEVQDTESEIKIVYRDNGIGINTEDINRVFEMFYTTKRGEGGSGLGLHIVSNLVEEKLNGTIECFSTLGEGVTFELIIGNSYSNS